MSTRAGIGITAAVLLLIVIFGGGWLVWEWGFCRFYVPPDHMAVIVAKEGQDLPPGQILAEAGQKGVRAEPLGEGRHFRNPIMYEWQIVPAVIIPAGKCGVVTSKIGTDLPQGEFLAEPGQKGIWRRVLGPGKYRLNPVGYDVNTIDAISVPIGYVGVATSLSGTQAPEGAFAGPGQKGVREDVLQPGLYYVNPHEFKIDVLEIGLNQVSLTGKEGGQVLTKSQLNMQNVAMQELADNVLRDQKQKRQDYIDREMQQQAAPAKQAPQAPAEKKAKRPDATPQQAPTRPFVGNDSMATLSLAQFVEFPSRDGFEIRLDMTVEFELLPKNISEIFRRYGDLPAVVDKIIMPQILSVSRLKGSNYGAKDFIVGEGREKFQNDLKDTLLAILADKDIVIHNALIRHVTVPQEILDPIQQAALAVEQDRTNLERQNTAKKQADLNTQEALIDQRRQEVMQETQKLVAETKADQEREVAQFRADTERQVAEVQKQTAGVKAQIARCLGEATAKVTSLVEGEKAHGFELKVQALGKSDAYTTVEFAEKLNPNLTINILHAGPGTLWTDLKNPRMSDLTSPRKE